MEALRRLGLITYITHRNQRLYELDKRYTVMLGGVLITYVYQLSVTEVSYLVYD